jgi:hypothetical protein
VKTFALGLTFLAFATLSALAEDCWNGPSGINSQPQWMAHVTVPRGRYVEMQFTFNAAWENMVFVCTWRQSPMKTLFQQGNVQRIGFNDGGGPNFDNALVTIHKVGFE